MLNTLKLYENYIDNDDFILNTTTNYRYSLYKNMSALISIIEREDKSLDLKIAREKLRKLYKTIVPEKIKTDTNLKQKLLKRYQDHKYTQSSPKSPKSPLKISSLRSPLKISSPKSPINQRSSTLDFSLNSIDIHCEFFHSYEEDDDLVSNISLPPKNMLDPYLDEGFIKNFPVIIEPDTTTLVGFHKDIAICYIKILKINPKECEIESVYVLSHFKSMGICKKIMHIMSKYLYESEVKKIKMHIMVNENNRGSSLLCYFKSLYKHFPIYYSDKYQDLDNLQYIVYMISNKRTLENIKNIIFPEMHPDFQQEILDEYEREQALYELFQGYYYFYTLDYFQ